MSGLYFCIFPFFRKNVYFCQIYICTWFKESILQALLSKTVVPLPTSPPFSTSPQSLSTVLVNSLIDQDAVSALLWLSKHNLEFRQLVNYDYFSPQA